MGQLSSNPSLDSLLSDAVASDYESAGADRHTSPVIRILAAGSAVLLTFVFIAAVIDKHNQSAQVNSTRQALIDRITAADKRVALAQKEVVQSTLDLGAAESAHLAGTSLGEQAQKRLEVLRKATGFTELFGPGLQVTLDDAPDSTGVSSSGFSLGQVRDRDVQSVVNGLWASGATGIAINGQRLTALSAIRNAGEAILVDYRPLSAPYRIVAISQSADATAGTFRDGVAGLMLEQLSNKYGVVWNIATLGDTTLPAASSSVNLSGGKQ
ncbi:MAG: DUF881 domain-containing protein [Actinomycetes bacterium]